MNDFLIAGRDYLARSPGFELIGRQEELKKLCSILVRKHSNSVILVAPSGVGATSLCMGLQAMKANTDAPFDIISKSIFWLDSNALFATGDSDAAERAFRAALTRLSATPHALLIIEDAGDFIDGCRNLNLSHFVNLINAATHKRVVTDGGTSREVDGIQVIFETSDRDMDKVLKWHTDIRESYTIMDVPEPKGDDLLEIVKSASKKLGAYHEVAIDQDAILAAIELTEKYRAVGASSFAQPKRSIGLLDRSLASYRLAAHTMPPAAAVLKTKIDAGTASADETQEFNRIMMLHADRQMRLKKFHGDQRDAEAMILALEEERVKEQSASNERKASGEASPSTFASLSMGSREVQAINEKLSQWRKLLVDHSEAYADVAREINEGLHLDRTAVLLEFSRISGISVSKLGENEMLILRNLEGDLKSRVFGQDHAVEAVANAIKVSRVGRRNKHKPQAAFLLPGPSGVGKTEIAKQLAAILLGDPNALTRFDMSEYMERHAVSKLIGAPPGYEGFEAGGILTNQMRENRNRIILFDEIEKAHPDVFNLFLQILDDGRLTDNVGRVADFSDAIIIMTTNTGQPNFLRTDIEYPEQMLLCMNDLGEIYRPEFLNRFNGRRNIVGFKRLELPTIERIVTREIGDLARAYQSHGVEIQVSKETISEFCLDQYDPVVGARGLPGFINADLEPLIVNAILDRSAVSGSGFDVRYKTDSRTFAVSALAQAA